MKRLVRQPRMKRGETTKKVRVGTSSDETEDENLMTVVGRPWMAGLSKRWRIRHLAAIGHINHHRFLDAWSRQSHISTTIEAWPCHHRVRCQRPLDRTGTRT